MSNQLHYHPDGLVFIRDENSVGLYGAKAADFASDYGAAFPLPAGITEVQVIDGVMRCFDRKGNHVISEDAPKAMTDIMAALASLQTACAARLAAKLVAA